MSLNFMASGAPTAEEKTNPKQDNEQYRGLKCSIYCSTSDIIQNKKEKNVAKKKMRTYKVAVEDISDEETNLGIRESRAAELNKYFVTGTRLHSRLTLPSSAAKEVVATNSDQESPIYSSSSDDNDNSSDSGLGLERSCVSSLSKSSSLKKKDKNSSSSKSSGISNKVLANSNSNSITVINSSNKSTGNSVNNKVLTNSNGNTSDANLDKWLNCIDKYDSNKIATGTKVPNKSNAAKNKWNKSLEKFDRRSNNKENLSHAAIRERTRTPLIMDMKYYSNIYRRRQEDKKRYSKFNSSSSITNSSKSSANSNKSSSNSNSKISAPQNVSGVTRLPLSTSSANSSNQIAGPRDVSGVTRLPQNPGSTNSSPNNQIAGPQNVPKVNKTQDRFESYYGRSRYSQIPVQTINPPNSAADLCREFEKAMRSNSDTVPWYDQVPHQWTEEQMNLF